MKFNDTKAEYNFFKEKIDTAVHSVLESGNYLLGEKTELFEREFAQFVGKKYAVSVGNATDGLTIALCLMIEKMKKEHGVDPVVLLPSFSAFPTVVAVMNATYNFAFLHVNIKGLIDPISGPFPFPDIKHAIVVSVDLFGRKANVQAIEKWCKDTGSYHLEDSAQTCFKGSANNSSHCSVFSFYPTKPLNVPGDGGMIVSDDEELIKKARINKFYGIDKGLIADVGGNSRMSEINSAIALSKLDSFELLNRTRIGIAERYNAILRIKNYSDEYSVYHQYAVMVRGRNDVIIPLLEKEQIPYMIHYSSMLYDSKYVRSRQKIPTPDRVIKYPSRHCDYIISLPVHPFMKEEEISQVEEFLYLKVLKEARLVGYNYAYKSEGLPVFAVSSERLPLSNL